MGSEQNNTPEIFETQGGTAKILRLSERTLERWRLEGTGPVYRKFGKRVLYARADIIAWADAQRRKSTSDDSHTAQR
ncbi:MAG: helix-turn-helix transcriptional regulator [Alphaproteobacteria bacterium]